MNKSLRFLLPDLLGDPQGLTSGNGDLIFHKDFDPPPSSWIFFISFEEWEKLKTNARMEQAEKDIKELWGR